MPPQPDIFLETGRRAHEAGDLIAAANAYKAALIARPGDPKALFFLGNLHLEQAQASAAVACLQQAAAHQRNHPAVISSLARAYFAAGRFADAADTYRKVSRLQPTAAEFQIGLANALAMQQKFREAETLLRRVVARFPDSAYAWMNLGHVARDQQDFAPAIEHYRCALRCDPQLLDARISLGSALHSQLQFEDAELEYRACLAIDAAHPVARSNLVSVLIDLGRFTEAQVQCQAIIDDVPDFANAHAMMATAIASQGQLTQAMAYFARATTLSPDTQRYAQSHAAALCEVGRIEEGLRKFGKLLRECAEPHMVTQMVTPVLLASGYFAEGWSRHLQRPTALRIRAQFARLNLQQTLPPTSAGKHIGLLCEQGLGDELFFLRYAPQLKALGARITYCASPKLAAMLQRCTALDTVVSEPDDLCTTDTNLLIGDLPHALCAAQATSPAAATAGEPATLLRDFPWARAPYAPLPPPSLRIAPLQQAMDAVRTLLDRAGPPPYLGITWRGGTAPENQRGVEWKLFKEIPISGLGYALRAWPGTVLALQRHPARDELDTLQTATGRPIADLTALNDDLEQMLALLSVIDDYVGVSNTNMHLRAAAGKSARVLVPCPAEWRWMNEGASPWFPAFRIYRQSLDGRWDDALIALQHDWTTVISALPLPE